MEKFRSGINIPDMQHCFLVMGTYVPWIKLKTPCIRYGSYLRNVGGETYSAGTLSTRVLWPEDKGVGYFDAEKMSFLIKDSFLSFTVLWAQNFLVVIRNLAFKSPTGTYKFETFFLTHKGCWVGGGLLALISLTTVLDLHFHTQNHQT